VNIIKLAVKTLDTLKYVCYYYGITKHCPKQRAKEDKMKFTVTTENREFTVKAANVESAVKAAVRKVGGSWVERVDGGWNWAETKVDGKRVMVEETED